MKKHVIILIHLSVWILGIIMVYAYDYLTISYFDYRAFTVFSIISGTLINAVIFYFNSLLLLPKLLEKQIYLYKYIIYIGLLITILTLIEGFSDFVFNKYNNMFWDNISVKLSTEYFDLTFLLNVVFLGLSFGYGFTMQWYKNEILKRKLIQDKIQTELNLLKTQINPHFLFNTLNNIYGIARKSENQIVSNSISKLADLMRYITYETKEGKITLEKEIEYIKNYIELQKLRFSAEDDINIELTIQGDIKNKFIEPMLFLPIVENSFKHGISLQKKSEIFLFFGIDSNKIVFNAKNSIASQNLNESHSGMGLDNLQKRLELLYHNKYQLLINKEQNYYQISLTIIYNDYKN